MARELVRPPLTLCHGDCHLENIFFGEHFEGGCMFIDFGLTVSVRVGVRLELGSG